MMRALRFIALLPFLAVVASCTGDSKASSSAGATLPDGRNPKALEQALDSAALLKLEKRVGDWLSGDARSTWEAFVADGKVRRINESMHYGKTGNATLRMYFTASGKVASIHESRTEIMQHPDRWPTPSTMNFTLEFTGDSTGTSLKLVDGAPKPVQDFEIVGARNHALELLALASTAPAIKTP